MRSRNQNGLRAKFSQRGLHNWAVAGAFYEVPLTYGGDPMSDMQKGASGEAC